MEITNLSENIILVEISREPATVKELETLAKTAFEKNIIISFSNVDIVKAETLSELLKLKNLLESRNKRLILCDMGPATESIFKVTGLNVVFEFADDIRVLMTTLS